eukprot:jgi/Mesvir1/16483/Mv10041-RA.1
MRGKLGKRKAAATGGEDVPMRVVHPGMPDTGQFADNSISTTKYTAITFLPKSLYEQYRRVANIYFTVIAALSLTPITPITPVTTILPLVFVLAVSILKEAIEDYRRRVADREMNRREVEVVVGAETTQMRQWHSLRAGDIVKVKDDEEFPADLLFLSSDLPQGIAYVETSNLDGETNLKQKKSLTATWRFAGKEAHAFNGTVESELPNPSLYTFVGNLKLGDATLPLGPPQLLLRGSSLKNSHYIYGMVLYTGHDTKVLSNATDPPSKRSSIERALDKIIFFMFGWLITIAAISGAVFAAKTAKLDNRPWYLEPWDTKPFFNPDTPGVVGILGFITSIILYGFLVPISLYVTIEIVKVIQSLFINFDLDMYYEETKGYAKARTSNLNEELGMVQVVLSDKTGTLTQNRMEFFKCSIAGEMYGRGLSDVERDMFQRARGQLRGPDGADGEDDSSPTGAGSTDRSELAAGTGAYTATETRRGSSYGPGEGSISGRETGTATAPPGADKDAGQRAGKAAAADAGSSNRGGGSKPGGAGPSRREESGSKRSGGSKRGVAKLDPSFAFVDDRLEDGAWRGTAKHPELVHLFFTALAVCHTAIPEGPATESEIVYNAESPDEQALVVAAKRLGFFFVKRFPNAVVVKENTPLGPVEVEYQVLNTIAFSSARKRMSVVVRDPQGRLLLFTKGADSVVNERLAKGKGTKYLARTNAHVLSFASAGLRTLAIAYAELDEKKYAEWAKVYEEASTALRDREGRLEAAAESLEKELVLLGATAIEDKLQDGVKDTITLLRRAGNKVWILTGDKVETAVNIGCACGLLTDTMMQITVSHVSEDEGGSHGGGGEDSHVGAEGQPGAPGRSPGGSLVGVSPGLIREKEKAFAAYLKQQLTDALERMSANVRVMRDHPGGTGPGSGGNALIIDGKCLVATLGDELRPLFVQVVSLCTSVLCCRVSPIQKAQVTWLVRRDMGLRTLGIGDGANDVGMIMAADIGVGISGVEGRQAVLASDFAIGQFRFLQKLMLVHGRWSYMRITRLIHYFFYKNIVFGMTLFWVNLRSMSSGQTIYDDFYITVYNIIFTSIPVMVMACVDRDVNKKLSIKYPELYRVGPTNRNFRRRVKAAWMFNGLLQSVLLSFVTLQPYNLSSDRRSGRMPEMYAVGTLMYTLVILVVNLELAFMVPIWTWLHHFSIWGSIIVWFLYLLVYGAFPISWSGEVYKIFVSVLAPSAVYWLSLPVIAAMCLIPGIVFRYLRHWLFPEDYHIIMEKYSKRLALKNHGPNGAAQGGVANGVVGVEIGTGGHPQNRTLTPQAQVVAPPLGGVGSGGLTTRSGVVAGVGGEVGGSGSLAIVTSAGGRPAAGGEIGVTRSSGDSTTAVLADPLPSRPDGSSNVSLASSSSSHGSAGSRGSRSGVGTGGATLGTHRTSEVMLTARGGSSSNSLAGMVPDDDDDDEEEEDEGAVEVEDGGHVARAAAARRRALSDACQEEPTAGRHQLTGNRHDNLLLQSVGSDSAYLVAEAAAVAAGRGRGLLHDEALFRVIGMPSPVNTDRSDRT